MWAKLSVLVSMLLVLSLPFVVKSTVGGEASSRVGGDGKPKGEVVKLVVITPHVEQIRDEFGAGFARWHRRVYGAEVFVDWRVPGGTSDIMKQLEATAQAAVRRGEIGPDGFLKPGSAGNDLFFGGGSFEHGKMKEEKTETLGDGTKVKYRLGRPAGFDPKKLEDLYGENKIGVQQIYDPEQYWLGTALSGFGIVYNREVLKKLGLPEPTGFSDLTDPKYTNMLALADGRQSGSITTTYDSILNKYGWEKGWRILREMSANARYFASAATRVPVDVGQGEAAAGLSIDFYGRGQAQFMVKPGEDPNSGRVGYVDPAGAVYIDADPGSIVNGAEHPEIARRFLEFCLTTEAQALWQFPRAGRGFERLVPGKKYEDERDGQRIYWVMPPDYPAGEDGTVLGPERYELRRMPVRRMMYDPAKPYLAKMIDKADPFKAASDVKGRGWRDAIAPMMACFAMDNAASQRAAWDALNRVRAAAKTGIVSEAQVQELEAIFFAWPTHVTKEGKTLEFNETNFKAIREDTKRWRDPDHGKRSLIAYTAFYSGQYAKVVQRAKQMLAGSTTRAAS